jgi:hypothetical protein
MSFVGQIIHFFVENRTRRQSYDQVCQGLKSGGEKISALLHTAEDTPANRTQTGHVIGMERWGVQRLSCLLNGTTPVMDEYDGYRPSLDLSMPTLAEEFEKARSATLALAVRLEPLAQQKVPHNSMGNLSVKTWLAYLNIHASTESRAIKA